VAVACLIIDLVVGEPVPSLPALVEQLGITRVTVVHDVLHAFALVGQAQFDVVIVRPAWPSDPTARMLRMACGERGFEPLFVCASVRDDIQPSGFDTYIDEPITRAQLDHALRAGHRTN